MFNLTFLYYILQKYIYSSHHKSNSYITEILESRKKKSRVLILAPKYNHLAFWYISFIFFPFLLKINLFNWRLITLQYCNGFAIHWHESAMDAHVFPILSPPPTLLPNPSLWCTSSEHTVSCIVPGLVISYTYNIHVPVLFSQIIPPSPSPSESKSLFCASVSVLWSHINGYHYHLSKFHIYVLVYYIIHFPSGLLHSV